MTWTSHLKSSRTWGSSMPRSKQTKMMTAASFGSEPGVKDLPFSVRTPFAKAAMAEASGNFEEAARLLDEAIAHEASK